MCSNARNGLISNNIAIVEGRGVDYTLPVNVGGDVAKPRWSQKSDGVGDVFEVSLDDVDTMSGIVLLKEKLRMGKEIVPSEGGGRIPRMMGWVKYYQGGPRDSSSPNRQ